jgi:hypothetical protein
MYFLALSQAPPAFAIMSASSAPQTVVPGEQAAQRPVPRKVPTKKGTNTAVSPGTSISRAPPWS